MLPEFEYHRPASLEEAVRLLSELGPDARAIAGGTDLVVKMRAGLVSPRHVVDLSRLQEIRFIRDEGDRIRIGAATTLWEIENSEEVARGVPVLREAVELMASWHVKTTATIGGNLCNASPAADTAPPLMVHGATLVIVGPGGRREVPVENFFTGPGQTVLGVGEVLVEVVVPKLQPGQGAAFEKLTVREGALSIASAAALVEVSGGRVVDARVALGAVAPTPVRASRVEGALRGQPATREAVKSASREAKADVRPITDVRGSREYREEMSVTLVRRALEMALKMAGGVSA